MHRTFGMILGMSLALGSSAALADSFTTTKNGKSYTCEQDSGSSGGSCHDQPGNETCTAWKPVRKDCYPYTGSPVDERPGKGLLHWTDEQTCQYFDGCGKPGPKRTETQEGAMIGNYCDI